MGFSLDLMRNIGIVEILVAIFYLLPGRLGLIGSVLLSAYLGGAVVTHLRVGDQFVFPIILSLLAWTGYYLRDEDFRNYFCSCKK